MRDRLGSYLETLFRVTREAECTDVDGVRLSLAAASDRTCNICRGAHNAARKVMFIGNGGSMGIAAHMAIDFSKNGGMRAMALGDSAALTCLGNDFGYADVFARQIDWHGAAGDVLIAISSSGESANILNGVAAARSRQCKVVTFSGFRDDNRLRGLGDVNFYVRAEEYGFVEVAHQSLLHAMLDVARGWKPNARSEPQLLKRVGNV
jgi:D-sedoheptulose 7-phosphate isomerase